MEDEPYEKEETKIYVVNQEGFEPFVLVNVRIAHREGDRVCFEPIPRDSLGFGEECNHGAAVDFPYDKISYFLITEKSIIRRGSRLHCVQSGHSIIIEHNCPMGHALEKLTNLYPLWAQ